MEEVRRLEIGSGKFPRKGYTHIDIEASAKPDILGDFRTMSFSDLEEIIALHVLEHFSREEALKVLAQWNSWLKVGGRLIVETPDLERICALFTTQPERLWANRWYLNQSLYGSQEADWAFHRDGWWKDKFEELFPKLGFKIIKVWQKHSYIRYGESRTRYRLPDIRVVAEKI